MERKQRRREWNILLLSRTRPRHKIPQPRKRHKAIITLRSPLFRLPDTREKREDCAGHYEVCEYRGSKQFQVLTSEGGKRDWTYKRRQ